MEFINKLKKDKNSSIKYAKSKEKEAEKNYKEAINKSKKSKEKFGFEEYQKDAYIAMGEIKA